MLLRVAHEVALATTPAVWSRALLLLSGFCASLWIGWTGERHRADTELQQGLTLEIEGRGGSHRRRARMVTLDVAPTEAPSAFVQPGPFVATWRGAIVVPLRDRYTFRFEGRGEFELRVRDKVVLAVSGKPGERVEGRVRLRKGANDFVAKLKSLDDGSARVRLSWEGFEVPPEPVPPSVFRHDPSAAELIAAEDRAWGRRLVLEHRCLRCHDVKSAKGLSEAGPSFVGIGTRLDPAWVKKWLLDPRALRPRARMPRLLHAASKQQDAADIAAWLSSQAGEAAPALAEGSVELGGQLFARLGCVACHERPGARPTVKEPTGRKASGRTPRENEARVPLNGVRRKFREPAELAAFLRAPAAHYEAVRMPDFALTAAEAASLTRFLWDKALAKWPKSELGDAARGRRLAERLRCFHCHEFGTSAPKLDHRGVPNVTKMLENLGRKACGVDETAPAAYGFAAREREALRAFAAHETRRIASSDPDLAELAWSQRSPAEDAAELVRELRCVACHSYDGETELWAKHVDETKDIAAPKPKKEVSQRRPSLTWFGEKMHGGWMERLLRGEIEERPRPWLRARMPAFASRAKRIARGLASQHGVSRDDQAARSPAPDAGLAGLGRWLVGRRGFSCTLCHAVGDTAAHEVFEAHGVNFARVAGRLRKPFFDRWMRNPQRIERGTRMPTIPDEDGMTHFTEVLDGHAGKQFDAIWHWLMLGRKITQPLETADPPKRR